MIILGIDPGTAITGFGVIKSKKESFEYINCGCITTCAGLPLAGRLSCIYDDVKSLIKKYRPDVVAMEELFFFKNVKTAMTVSHARGVLVLAAQKSGLPIFEYTPLQIKQALTGYGRADKKQIQEMVKGILNLNKIPKPDDAADALAVAICHANSAKDLKIKK
jgi:crossover junction endodeoxyribonuclease RuvC